MTNSLLFSGDCQGTGLCHKRMVNLKIEPAADIWGIEHVRQDVQGALIFLQGHRPAEHGRKI